MRIAPRTWQALQGGGRVARLPVRRGTVRACPGCPIAGGYPLAARQ